jgi:mutator protein MutT
MGTPDRYRSLVAVYVMMFNEKNELFLSRRNNTGYRDGFYDMPAGHLEDGETLREAAVRELREETGIEAEDLEFVELLHRKSFDDRVYLDVFFRLTKWRGEPSIQEPEKCDHMAWFSLDALPEMIVPHQRIVLADRAHLRPYREVGWQGNLDV